MEAAHDNRLPYVGQKLEINFSIALHRSELSAELRKHATLFQLLKARAGRNKVIIPLQHT